MTASQKAVKMSRRPKTTIATEVPLKVKDLPVLGVSIHPDTRARLVALSTLQGRPLWQIVGEALERYMSSLPVDEQKEVVALARRMTGKR